MSRHRLASIIAISLASGLLASGCSMQLKHPAASGSSLNVSLSQSTLSVASSTLASGSTDVVTLTLRDPSGNALTGAGQALTFSTSGGTSTGTFCSSVTDHGDGTYTCAFTGVTAGTPTRINALVSGSALTVTAPTITVTPGPVSLNASVVTVASASTRSGSLDTITLTAKDAAGNPLSSGGLTVAFSAAGGTSTGTFCSSVTDHGDGTYTCAFTGGAAGTATSIQATIGGSAVTSSAPTITVSALSSHVASAQPDTAGISTASYERDGTHLVFVDNTPGKNGDLVIFREGDGAATIQAYVSTNGGGSWSKYALSPSAGSANAMGGVQDSVNHKFHLTWVDASSSDQYGRWTPTYTGGDITGFTLDTAFGFFDEGGDTPGPRDLAEIVDGAGTHRLAFTGMGTSSGGAGLVKFALTSPSVGLAPSAQTDWCKASDHTQTNTDDQLLPNSYSTSDSQSTFMLTLSSNVAGGQGKPFTVAAGFPVDKKLLSWTITAGAGNDFTISGPATRSSTFSGGGLSSASLSLFNAPSGTAYVVYGENSSSTQPGLHVATFGTSGTWTADATSQPTTSTSAAHAVIATDTQSNPAVLFADGSGNIKGTIYLGGAWSPLAQLLAFSPLAGWNLSNTWTDSGHDSFGIYLDNGSSSATEFASVAWY